MSTTDLRDFFDERSAEIVEYMNLLDTLADVSRAGPPRLQGAPAPLTVAQLRILHSTVYLQLYNLVEATVSRCMTTLAAVVADGHHLPIHLNMALRHEWIRSVARTHTDLTPENRHAAAVKLVAHFADPEAVKPFKFELGGGGNWNEKEIAKASRRVGCELDITPETLTAVRYEIRDERGSLELVRDRRNGLAHGSLSFVDCSQDVTLAELRTVADAVLAYLDETVASFDRYIAEVKKVPA